MSTFLFQIFLLCLLLFCLKLFKNYLVVKKGYVEPPGPFKFPIIGNLFQLFLAHPTLPHVALFKLSKKYGEIMSIKFGSINGVILSSHEAMSKILTKDECTSKFNYIYCEYRIPGFSNLGVLLSSGESWSETRRFTVKNLRSVGFGKHSSFDKTISKAVDDLTAKLCSDVQKSHIVKFDNYFAVSIGSLIWSYLFGLFVDLYDPKMKRYCDLSEDLAKAAKMDNIAIVYPILGKLFPKWTGIVEFKRIFNGHAEFYMEGIEKIKRQSFDKQFQKSFVSSFLNQIESEKGNPSTIFTMENLIATIADVFGAGSDTTANYLSFAILLMVHYPDVQKKIYDEITNANLTGTQISLSQMKTLPYIEATLLEIHRVSTVIPTVLPRQATEDIIYKGYIIPKGSLVMPNIYAAFNDEEYWGDPAVFRPERFLDSDNCINTDLLNAQLFGYGKRACIGEGLARASIFLFFTNFIRRFEFLRIENENLPTLDPVPRFTLAPYPFECIVKIR